MQYYRILSSPFSKNAPARYKGIYRSEPDYRESDGDEIHALWYRYVSYAENGATVGVTDELSVDELLYFSKLLSEKRGTEFETVCIGNEKNDVVGGIYYGMDVSSVGGYSMIGEGFFKRSPAGEGSERISALNRLFGSKLNRYGLFPNEEDARMFLDILNDFKRRGLIEPEDAFIFRISHVG